MLLRCWDNVRVDVSSSNTGCGFEGWSLIRSRFVVIQRYRVQHRRKWATDVLRIILVPPQTYADRIQSVCYHANLRRWLQSTSLLRGSASELFFARPTLTGTCWLQGGLRTSANRHSNDVRGSLGLVSYVTAGRGIKLPMLGNCSGSVTVAELEELIRLPTHPLFWTLRHSIYDTPANYRCFASCWER